MTKLITRLLLICFTTHASAEERACPHFFDHHAFEYALFRPNSLHENDDFDHPDSGHIMCIFTDLRIKKYSQQVKILPLKYRDWKYFFTDKLGDNYYKCVAIFSKCKFVVDKRT